MLGNQPDGSSGGPQRTHRLRARSADGRHSLRGRSRSQSGVDCSNSLTIFLDVDGRPVSKNVSFLAARETHSAWYNPGDETGNVSLPSRESERSPARSSLPQFSTGFSCNCLSSPPSIFVEVRTVPAAALKTHDNLLPDEILRPASPQESSRQPRFRVVTRKPLPAAPRRRPNAVRNALMIAAVPSAFLLVYVIFWTMAISGGYTADRLRNEIAQLKVEQADQRMQKLALTSPGRIQAAAEALGMRRNPIKKYISVPQEK